MKHAGVSASDATFVEAEYDYDDGRMVYEVEFHVKGTEYDYEIDAQTGEVVTVSYTHLTLPTNREV